MRRQALAVKAQVMKVEKVGGQNAQPMQATLEVVAEAWQLLSADDRDFAVSAL